MRKPIPLALPPIAILLSLMLGCSLATPQPTATPPPPSATQAPTATPAPTNTPTPTDTPEPTATPAPTQAPGYEWAKQYEGGWSGGWLNKTFGSTGSAEATVTINDDSTFAVVLDLGGRVFGMSDPPPLNFSGTYGAEVGSFAVQGDPLFGDLSLDVAQEKITGGMDNNPFNFGMTLDGSLTPEQMELNYAVTLPTGQAAQGVLSMTHQ